MSTLLTAILDPDTNEVVGPSKASTHMGLGPIPYEYKTSTGLERVVPLTVDATFDIATPATGSVSQPMWICPTGQVWELTGVDGRAETAGTSGKTITIYKAASGTALGSGTSMGWTLADTAFVAGTTVTNNSGITGAAGSTARQITAGQAIGFVTNGTLTTMANLSLVMHLVRVS